MSSSVVTPAGILNDFMSFITPQVTMSVVMVMLLMLAADMAATAKGPDEAGVK